MVETVSLPKIALCSFSVSFLAWQCVAFCRVDTILSFPRLIYVHCHRKCPGGLSIYTGTQAEAHAEKESYQLLDAGFHAPFDWDSSFQFFCCHCWASFCCTAPVSAATIVWSGARWNSVFIDILLHGMKWVALLELRPWSLLLFRLTSSSLWCAADRAPPLMRWGHRCPHNFYCRALPFGTQQNAIVLVSTTTKNHIFVAKK